EVSMGRYLEIFRRTPTEREISEKSEKNGRSSSYSRKREDLFRNDQDTRYELCETSGTAFAVNLLAEDLIRLPRFFRVLQELERRCPAFVDPSDWLHAVEDA